MKTKKVIMAVTAFSLALGASTASWAGSAKKPLPQGQKTTWRGDLLMGWVIRVQPNPNGESVTRWVVDKSNGPNNGRVTMQQFN